MSKKYNPADHGTHPAQSATPVKISQPEGGLPYQPETDSKLAKGKYPMNPFERSTLTWTRTITVITGILVLITGWQVFITKWQLDTMRKDQRPWIKVTSTYPSPQALAPIGASIRLLDSGKTPAKAIRGDFFVEKVINGESPKLDQPYPHTVATAGMITPGDFMDFAAGRVKNEAGSVQQDPLTPSEFEDFNQTKIFFVVYGVVTYTDFFGTSHWTKFCAPLIPINAPQGSKLTMERCTSYSDVDNN